MQRSLKIISILILTGSLLRAGDMLVRLIGKREMVRELIRTYHIGVVDRKGDTFTLYLDQIQYAELSQKGYRIEVIIPDIQSYVMDRVLSSKRTGKGLTDQYHTYSEIISIMDSIAQAHPDIVKLDTIGYSVQGRLLLAAKVSDNPQIKEDEAEVRIVGCHHGNEWPSAEIPLYLLAYLVDNYGTDPYITYLVNNREIWIMPMVNPDGHEAQTRENANGIDLNRNYGYMWTGAGGDSQPYGQPETDAMYRWSLKENFTMGLTYHTYHPAVNYIWNYSPDHIPDSALVVQYAQMYGDSTAAHGDAYWITEGYDWYQTYGDLNDFSMGITGINDVTIELCHEFVPPASELDTTWRINKGAILAFINKAGQGIHGYVIDSATGDTIKQAMITTLSRNWPVFSDPETGDYFLATLPGTYTLIVKANGYLPETIPNITVMEDSAVKVDVYLRPGGGYYAHQVVAAHIDDQSTPVIKPHIPSALGEPDGEFVPLNDNGWIILDMGEQTPIINSFTVYEGDDGTPNEGYKVYVANDYKGPWYLVGDGTGTQTFSITGTGLSGARYVKIVDAGTNSSSGAVAGFDLDAIVNMRGDTAIVVYSNTVIQDTAGNINGKLDPGDKGYFEIAFVNIGTIAAESVKVFAYSLTPSHLTLTGDTVEIDSLPSGDTLYLIAGFEVSEDCPIGSNVSFAVVYSYSSGSGEDTVSFVVGQKDSTFPTGPDGYGYFAYDSKDTAYSEYEPIVFKEISSQGNSIPSPADDGVYGFALPFTFTYYGTNFDSVYVSTNGWISFHASSSAYYTNNPIPSGGDVQGVIAPYWDDLNPSSGGGIYYYYDDTAHEFIIEWKDVPHYGSTSTLETFEVILRDPLYYPTLTGDGEIIFVYSEVGRDNSATVGIESNDESTGIQYLYNGVYDTTASVIAAGKFIKFTTDTPAPSSEITQRRQGGVSKGLLLKVPAFQSPNSVIAYLSVNKAGEYAVRFYDILGRKRFEKSLHLKPGFHKLRFKTNLKAGLYFMQVKGGGKQCMKKVLLR